MKSSTLIMHNICLGIVSAFGIAFTVAAEEIPLAGSAYMIADQAYRDFNNGHYADAIKNAEEAIRLRPDVTRLYQLLENAKKAQQQKFSPFLQQTFPTKQTLVSAASPTSFMYAQNAWGFAQAKNISPGLRDIDVAIQKEPNNVHYVVLKIYLLLLGDRVSDAETLTHQALKQWNNNISVQLLAAYFFLQKNDNNAANTLYHHAIANTDAGEIPLYNARLIAADAAISHHDETLLKTALQYLETADKNAGERQQYFALLKERPDLEVFNTLTKPVIECHTKENVLTCDLVPADRPSERLYQVAYQYFLDKQFEKGLDILSKALSIAPEDAQLIDKEGTARRELAAQYAIQAHTYLVQDKVDDAEIFNRKAIEYDPDRMTYRLVLIESLINQQRYQEAEKAVSEAIQNDPDDPVPMILRGYLKQQQNHYAQAVIDYNTGLNNPYLTEADRRDISLYIADAALTASDFTLYQQALSPLTASHPEVRWRQYLYQIYQSNASLKVPLLQQPMLDCRDTPYETACTIRPLDNAIDRFLSVIYQELHQQRYQDAQEHAAFLQNLYPNHPLYDYVHRQALAVSGKTEPNTQAYVPPLSLAYLSVLAPAPQQAAEIFKDMENAGTLSVKNYRDAAYTAINNNQKPLAKDYLYRAIDAANSGEYVLPPQELYDTRSTVSNIDRLWGMAVTASYRGDSSVSIKKQGNTANDSLQLTAEGFYRPEKWNKDNRYVDFYGRLTGNAYGESGTSTGLASTLSAVGIRIKPFSKSNIVLSFERQMPIGSKSEGDWLARLAYSHSYGTDYKVEKENWFTHQFYGETGKYFDSNTFYIVSEEQIGRTYKVMDNLWKNTTIFPHAVLSADYNDGFSKALAVGAGAGINLRHWFREDTYHAPQSYLDFSVQYRFKITGDDRAGGLVARVTLNY